MATPRIRHVQNKREFESVRDDFITQGYEVLNEGQATLLMRKSTWGSLGLHVLVAIFTIWWTLGIGNVIYAVIAHYTAEQVLIKIDEQPQGAQGAGQWAAQQQPPPPYYGPPQQPPGPPQG